MNKILLLGVILLLTGCFKPDTSFEDFAGNKCSPNYTHTVKVVENDYVKVYQVCPNYSASVE